MRIPCACEPTEAATEELEEVESALDRAAGIPLDPRLPVFKLTLLGILRMAEAGVLDLGRSFQGSSGGVGGIARLLAEDVLEADSRVDSSQAGMVSEVRRLGTTEE